MVESYTMVFGVVKGHTIGFGRVLGYIIVFEILEEHIVFKMVTGIL